MFVDEILDINLESLNYGKKIHWYSYLTAKNPYQVDDTVVVRQKHHPEAKVMHN